ncbi:uncharacterized protein LOC128310510 [Anopheles moucheti]|uniref:uncharacterized protein LOC128310510 n=1 Tax=Anopheles moucheti TaxID=186751 RepID=UPI0022F04405|nr:uncharacterized protein LOC128310510 [Anopheles moucheti]
MATDINDRPMFRISDVEELIRQTGMDSSDTGEKIVDYFKNKRAALQSRARLYDGSDNSINFRLDNLQPVQLPQTNSHLPRESSPVPSSNVTEAAGIALIKPLSELSVAVNRVPSFMSPGGVTATSPSQIPRNPPTNIITSPTGRSTVHVSPILSCPKLHSDRTNLQKQLLLQQYKRKNQMKCEAIRSASQLASSTPIAGEPSERRGNNLLDIRETISPIHEDQEHGTPQRILRSPNAKRSTAPHRINTPVPATQDVPDGMDQDYRENTPPRDDNHAVVVPETPSPVRRSPRAPSTPLSGLSLQHRPHLYAAIAGQARLIENHVPTPRRSILKNSDKSFSSGNRVSFSENLIAVRSMTPAGSSNDSQITSDESDEQDREMGEPRRKKLSLQQSRSQKSKGNVQLQQSRFMMNMAGNQIPSAASRSPDNAIRPLENSKDNQSNNDNSSIEVTPRRTVETSVLNDNRNVHLSRRFFANSRSNAMECIEELPPASSGTTKSNRNCTNSNVINMIMEDWAHPSSETMEVDDPNENCRPQVANQTIIKSLAITNIETPRTVMMDIFDPPSAFCDDSQQGDELDGSRSSPIAEQVSSDAPGLDRSDPSRKRKQNSIARQGSIDKNESVVAPNAKGSLVPTCVAQRSIALAERIVSTHSPNDHIPLNMIEAVDMIHSRVNSEIIASESENDRRTTLNMPTKRRTTKLKLDADAEKYIKSIEAVYSQDKVNNKTHRNRRKLFAQELSNEQDSNCDEPQPLPSTQEVAEPTPQPEKKNGYVVKPLSVVVQRLSATTLSMATNSIRTLRNAELEKDIDEQIMEDVQSSVKEPQNMQCEKLIEEQHAEQDGMEDRPIFAHRKSPPAPRSPSCEDNRPVEVEKTAKQKSKHEVKNKKKRTHQKQKGLDESNLMMDKYLKNMSNEIRQQIESDAPRRSHRNRRLAAEVLRNNPDISCHTAPRYVMPTIKDVLKYCQLSNMTITAGNAKKRSKTSNAAKTKTDMKKQKVVPPATSSAERKELGGGIVPKRGRPRKNQLQKETFDNDGFRIPNVPSNQIPGTSSNGHKATDRTTETNCSSNSGLRQGVSIDSGLSSAATLTDDVTATPQLEQPSTSKMSSKPNKKPVDDPAPSCSSASPSPTEIMAEKRKTLDWMMMLMENQQKPPVAILPIVQIQGFTHLSLEHLTFEERDGIEYSFYVYSNGDNFGFLRFPPATEKKTTRTKRCSLRFLILSGSLKFIINESVVNAVGGDFLMIPISSSYRIVNGPDTTLIFMIKTSDSTNTKVTTHENGG